ncbi:Nitrate reductase delta subunit [Thermosyntropha lipolytica DSM 11003]|uniref:Nitrate reductase delta subunit n=1 Tax=Thermosyntropha lipolytica DSM 11003 TaxID=1123382 RepID=A0A1M5LLB7_9FIRM|nr:molecular chaperone TorD family protein [Thermosyntropha lipolytica]SHG65805.1 Nitrate reductase delta subunit [Thermosyntropha lipolytica DSM 11003]
MTILLNADFIWGLKNLLRYPERKMWQENRSDLDVLLDWAEREGLPVESIKGYVQDEEKLLADIEIDFTRLFINGVPTAKAHPFAGWYRGDKIVFGETDREMLAFYSRYGFIYDEDSKLPADHILVELEFLALMLEEYQHNPDDFYIKGIKEILGHMKQWVPDFIRSIKNHAQTDFYKEVAGMLEYVLHMLEARLEEVKTDG